MHMATRNPSAKQFQKEGVVNYFDSNLGVADDDKVGGDCRGHCPAPRPPHVSVEKVDGGMLVAGVIVFNSCQFILPAFGCLFLIVGIVLTVTSYQGVATSDKVQQYIERVEFTKNSRLLGPICLVVASLMIFSGLILCIISKRARLKDKRIGFHCPIHGDFYPSNPYPASFMNQSKQRLWCCIDENGDKEDLVGLPPQCPHSILSSQRSSFSSSACPMSPCPAPLPFVVTSGSLSGLTMGSATMPSELVFGSIRSLSVSHDVASFPASRSPSPTPVDSSRVSPAPSPVNIIEEVGKIDAGIVLNSQVIAKVIPEIKLVAPAPNLHNINYNNLSVNLEEPRRKSVTILLPGEENKQC